MILNKHKYFLSWRDLESQDSEMWIPFIWPTDLLCFNLWKINNMFENK